MESPENPDLSAVDLSLVVLASNEKPDLGLFAEMMNVYRRELDDQPRSYEIIVVDDGAAGDFFDAAMELKKNWPQLKIIQFRRAFGESVALSVAVGQARGRFVITSGWYLQVDARGLKRAVDLLEGGYDFVAMRRRPRCDGWLARFQSWLFNTYTRWITKVRLHDLNCSFRAFRREVVEDLSFHGDLFRFIGILAYRQGFRVREISLKHLREEGSATILAPGIYLRRFLDILALFFLMKFTRKPLRFFGMVGAAFFASGFIISAYMTWLRLMEDEPLADKPMLILGIFLIVLGIIISSIGLIGEIIIFTHGKDYRDYHIAKIVEGGALPAVPAASANPDQIVIQSMTAPRRGSWQAFVDAHEHATLFHDLRWRDILVSTFRHQPHYIMAERAGEIVGVLPLLGIHSLFLGRSLVSVPFGVYGGILANDPKVSAALCEEARRLASETDAGYVELRHLHPPPGLEDLPQTDLYHTFIGELPEDPSLVMSSLPRKARAEARKARNSGKLETHVNRISVEEFHRLFTINKRRLGSPPFPKSLFYNIMEELGDDVLLLSVHEGRSAIAAVMSFVFQDTLMAYYSGSVPAANHMSANNLMYVALMEEAVKRGLRFFDFGRSRKGTGSFRFKHNQGFEARVLCYQYLLSEGQEIPANNNSNPRFDVARTMFRLLPRFASERVGSYVSKRLPI